MKYYIKGLVSRRGRSSESVKLLEVTLRYFTGRKPGQGSHGDSGPNGLEVDGLEKDIQVAKSTGYRGVVDMDGLDIGGWWMWMVIHDTLW